MHLQRTRLTILGLVALMVGTLSARQTQAPAWQDRSKHQVSFVTVDQGVTLEVLDWVGSGRPILVLTGSGHTALVFDEFAPNLTDC